MLLPALFLLTVGQVAQSSLGPGLCLISRLSCSPKSRNVQYPPGQNQFGVYSTEFEHGRDGLLRCNILAENQRVTPILVIGSTNQVFSFTSPGYSSNYGNQQLVEYNINCGEGRLAFVEITDMNLEPKNCQDRFGFLQPKCRDFVQTSGPFGISETCGNDTSVDLNPSLQSSLRIKFRSSPFRTFPGFAANVVCFQPEISDSDCSTTARTAADTRKDSFFEDLDERIQHHAGILFDKRKKRGTLPIGATSGGFQAKAERRREIKIKVSPTENVSYYRKAIYILGRKILQNVAAFFVHHSTKKLQSYSTSALYLGFRQHFRGPGLITVIGHVAYYYIYSPKDFSLTKSERRVLANLTRPRFTLTQEPTRTSQVNSQDFFSEIVNQQTTSSPSTMFSNEEINLARQYENDCNPILRASSRSIIEQISQSRLNTKRSVSQEGSRSSKVSAAYSGVHLPSLSEKR